MPTLRRDEYRHIVVLTGAGVSAGSGLPTYRGPGGLWEQAEVAQLATAEAWARTPEKVWAFFAAASEHVRAVSPNAAHHALAAWERDLVPGTEFTLITQNVDGLHTRAGSRNVAELHGNLSYLRCSNPSCDLPRGVVEFGGAEHATASILRSRARGSASTVPHACERCGQLLRPDVVLFGEPIPVDPEWQAKMALRECDLFVAVGTSGTVSPASNFVRSASYVGARTVLINLEPMNPRNPFFQEEYLGRAEDLLPQLLERK